MPRSSLVPPALFVGQGIAQYVGASLAVGLFALMPAPTVAWWRLVVAAVVLLAWRRPWGGRVRWRRRELASAALFGVMLASMNILIYLAIARIPMGPAVALEFTGPIVVAAIAGRGVGDRIAIGLAALGVLSIGGVGLDHTAPGVLAGIAFALAAAVTYALYIHLGHALAADRVRAGGARPAGPAGVDSLAVGMAVGAALYTPIAVPTMAGAWSSAPIAAGVIGVAVLSSVLPYVIDQINFGRLSASAFAILTALLPATSVAVAAIMLHQVPNLFEWIGLILISGAVALAGRAPATTTDVT